MGAKHPCPTIPKFPDTEGIPAKWHIAEANGFLDGIRKVSGYLKELSIVNSENIIQSLQEFTQGDTVENLKQRGVTIEKFNRLSTILNSISNLGIAASYVSIVLSACTESELEILLKEINHVIAGEISNTFLIHIKEKKQSAQDLLKIGNFSGGLSSYLSAVNLIDQIYIAGQIESWTRRLGLIDAIKLEIAFYDHICIIKEEILAVDEFYKKSIKKNKSISSNNNTNEQEQVEKMINMINDKVDTLIKIFKKMILNYRANAIDIFQHDGYLKGPYGLYDTYEYMNDRLLPERFIDIEAKTVAERAFKFASCHYKLVTVMKWKKDLDEKSGVCKEASTDRPEDEIAENTIKKLGFEYSNYLASLEDLWNGNYLISENGEYTAGLLKNGDFIISKSNNLNPDTILWNEHAGRDSKGPFVLRMQRDGNLVLCSEGYIPIWETNTHGNEDAYFVLTDDGKLILYNREDKPIWIKP